MRKGIIALGLMTVLAGGGWAYTAFTGNCCGSCPLPGAADAATK